MKLLNIGMLVLILILQEISHCLMDGVFENQHYFEKQETLQENHYYVEYYVNTTETSIVFKVTVRTKGYIGLGFSHTGKMEGSDIVMGGVYPNGSTYFGDYHGIGLSMPKLDESQDYKLLDAWENSTHTQLIFSRKFSTCDEHDMEFNDDTIKMIWSYGFDDQISYHLSDNRGVHALNILDPENIIQDLSQYKKWTISKPEILPKNDTMYYCTFFKGPNITSKHHVIGFDMHFETEASKKHTHHSDFYRCKAPPGKNAEEIFGKHLGIGYDCYHDTRAFPREYCEQFEFQWSIGGKATIFPENIGSPIGEDPGQEFFMTEIHYDNPDSQAGISVHSGMNFYLTENLRPLDAGFLFVGAYSTKTYALTVPPNTEEMVVNSHCSSECTKDFPEGGLHVFLYLLHSHLSGRKQRIRHFRNGFELPYLANDENYDFNYQNNRHLGEQITILPGDHLTLECVYDTRWRSKNQKPGPVRPLTTIGGRSPREEMCQTFLMYYPKHPDFNECGSNFPQTKMLKYFGIENVTKNQGEIDPTVISPSNLAGMKYSAVVDSFNWTSEKRKEFQNFYRFSEHEGFCYPHKKDFGMVTYPSLFEPYVAQSKCNKVDTGKDTWYLGVWHFFKRFFTFVVSFFK